MSSAEASARHLTLGDRLRAIRAEHDGFDLLHHHKQEEFHHDAVCFEPCELLGEDARSELRPEFRRRQRGGGWEPAYE